jgi:hypothetical protein
MKRRINTERPGQQNLSSSRLPEGDLKAMYRRHCSIDLTCQAYVVDFRFPLACCVREQGLTAAKIVVSIG